jgi:hypothetical protein
MSFLSRRIDDEAGTCRIVAERGGSLETPDTTEADLLREFWRIKGS